MARRKLVEGDVLPWEGGATPEPRRERKAAARDDAKLAKHEAKLSRRVPGTNVLDAVPAFMRRALARRAAQVERAREDPDAFVEFVLKGEDRKERVVQALHHREMQAAFTSSERLVLFEAVEHGKSFQLLGRVLWEIGRNPSVRVAYISGSILQAKKFVKQVREYIESSALYHLVFPEVQRSTHEGSPWTQTQLEVERPIGIKDPTLQAFGVGSGSITGSRLEVVILDDILDGENTRTPEQRAKVLAWIDSSSVEGRLGPTGRMWVVGTPWHPADPMHELEKRPSWRTIRRAAVENPSRPEAEWTSTWPLRWPLARLLKKRAGMVPDEFARQFLVVARDDKAARFRGVWFDRALLRGQGQSMPFRYRGPLVTVSGVDLAVGRKSENDETSLVTLAIHPNGDRQLLFVESGRWSAREIIDKIKLTWKRYDTQLILVEDNAAQAYLVELLAESSPVPVEGFTTSGAKHDPVYGFEQMAVELNNGKWILPSDAATGRQPVNDEERKLIEEVKWYSPSEHTGDRAMACYFAREAAKQVGFGDAKPPDMRR